MNWTDFHISFNLDLIDIYLLIYFLLRADFWTILYSLADCHSMSIFVMYGYQSFQRNMADNNMLCITNKTINKIKSLPVPLPMLVEMITMQLKNENWHWSTGAL